MTLIATRRNVLQYSLLGGALIVGVPLAARGQGQPSEPQKIGVFVTVAPNNDIFIGAPAAEMGQGTFTSLPMILAEELDVDWARVTVEPMPLTLKRFGDDETNLEGGKGGISFAHAHQGSGGSQTVRRNYTILRNAGAEIRDRLVRTAAAMWGIDAKDLTTSDGVVIGPRRNQRASYGELAAKAATLSPAENVPLKDPKDFKLIGTHAKIKGSTDIVTGAPIFGIDQEIPGMLHAVLARAPYFQSKGAISVNDEAARAVEGVVDVIRIERNWPEQFGENQIYLYGAVAVVAKTLWAAMKARRLLEVEWDKGEFADESTTAMEAEYRRIIAADGEDARTLLDNGDVESAMAAADTTHEASYLVKALSHVCMEPHSAVADMRPGNWLIRTSHQYPNRPAFSAAQICGCDVFDVRVEMARLGGGFGRKFDPDYVSEAIFLSHKLQKPVKVTWTREDDIQQDAFNPPGMSRVRAGVDAEGRITAWDHLVVDHDTQQDVPPAGLVKDVRVRVNVPRRGMRFGPWRGPGHNTTGFVIESFLDELAHLSGTDPLDYRLGLLGDQGPMDYPGWGADEFNPQRLGAVLRLAAEKADWRSRTSLPKGRGRGIAGYFTFGGYCAHVVDVTVEDGDFTVDRVVSAVDCGQPVNLLGIEAQIEGGAIDGLSVARRQAIHVENGQVVERNFDSYEMMRIDGAPKKVEVHVVPSRDFPAGTGEISLPPFIPALTNAIFAATGKRIRELPIADQLRE